MSEQNAIVILYKGHKPSKETIKKLGEVIASKVLCDVNTLSITHLNENDILVAATRKVLESKEIPQEPQYSQLDCAIEYIGKRFYNELKTGGSMFATNVSSAYLNALMRNDDRKLVESIRIIASSDMYTATPEVRQRSNFGFTEWDCIITIHKNIHWNTHELNNNVET